MEKKNNTTIQRLKLFFLFFFFSAFLSSGVNVLQLQIEDYIYEREIADYPAIQADISSFTRPIIFKPIREEASPPLIITAESALAVYINPEKEEFVLFEKNPQAIRPVASLTKMITALTVLDIYKLSDIIRISPEAVKQEGEQGDLSVGEFLSVRDLLKIMLIESSNDAAFSFASNYLSGTAMTPSAFRDLMNLEIKHNLGLDLRNTAFQNPTGLDPDNGIEAINHSTARDLFEITKYILWERPEILEILAMPETTVAGRYLKTTNKLLYNYPEIIGGKTGYTEKAQGCLIIVLEAPGENAYFINIILGSQERFQDMEKMMAWLKDSYTFRLD